MAYASLETMVTRIARNARQSALSLQSVSIGPINESLIIMADLLETAKATVQKENKKDLLSAVRKKLSAAMIDRLAISDKTIASMAQGLREVATLSSSVGQEYNRRVRPNGLEIYKLRVPIGVVGIIYESRPNVTVDAAAICLKSGNAVILRGGSEALHSNLALVKLFRTALVKTGLPADAVQAIPVTDRAAIGCLLTLSEYIDLIIPRGGESLIRMVVEKSRIPVIKHYKGVCHVFVSAKAEMARAIPIAINAKVQRPGVCNAMETLLLDAALPFKSRRDIIDALLENGVTLFGDPDSRKLSSAIRRATIDDWTMEYLDLRLAVRTVKGVDAAIEHINKYGSHHTDAIVTESIDEADRFAREVDSASVMINASTRFADGGEFGMGCEIGISTDKLHARGPMGVDDLTTYKWIVKGSGQVRG